MVNHRRQTEERARTPQRLDTILKRRRMKAKITIRNEIYKKVAKICKLHRITDKELIKKLFTIEISASYAVRDIKTSYGKIFEMIDIMFDLYCYYNRL